MLRKAALAVLLSHACGAADEASLMQGLKPESHRPSPVANLIESAKGLLKNGATPDVVEFTRDTLEEISTVVIPAIERDSILDQDMLNREFALFENATAALEDGVAVIHQLSAQERLHSAAHKTCRDEEAVKCTTKITCDYNIYTLWTNFVHEERDLRTIEHDITLHFCEDLNGTLTTFRHSSVQKMEAWHSQWIEVKESKDYYDDKHPVCTSKYTQLDDKTNVCDAHQTALEEAACDHATAVRSLRVQFYNDWNMALTLYSATKCNVQRKQADRIKEYQTLSVVQCLLDRTTERNGRPCDDTTDEAVTEMTTCEEVRLTVDIDFLILTYWEIPPTPQFCVNQYQEGYALGRCIPEPPNYPCSAGFSEREYSELPAVPQPEFHSGNSHCNQQPECDVCIALEQPEPPLAVLPEPQCDSHVVCCEAHTIECSACAAGVAAEVFCTLNPTSDLCQPVVDSAPYNLAQTGTQCSEDPENRLFRLRGHTTLEECYAQCQSVEGCNHFSYGELFEGANQFVCLGCKTLEDPVQADGHNAYDMLSLH